jgi:3-hydroxyisobutyrate dehydrogenase
MKAFLGMGLLGANFVKAMLQRGEEVHIWNRTADKAKQLESFGAKVFSTPADAVKGANTIHLTLVDDKTVDDVLEKAEQGFENGVIIIDHTTTTEKGAIYRTQRFRERGYIYLHAPVFMGSSNALNSTGYMLVSGDQDVIKKVEHELAKMTGKVINFGSVTGKAAGIKLLGNLFLLSLTAGISDMLALAKALNIPTSDITALFNEWNPGAGTPSRLKRILSAQFDEPSWKLQMARKDARLMMEEADNGHMLLAIIPAIAKEMDKWIENGFADKDWTVFAKNNLS